MSQPGGPDALHRGDGTGARFVEPVRRARERASAEREELVDEADALDAFDSRLAGVAVEAPPAPSDTRLRRVARPGGADSGPSAAVERVREAYRETVMSVPHYDRMYGESLAEHLAAELGPALAAMVDGDGPGTFTPERRDALRSAVRSVAHRRRELVDVLDAEADSLDRAAEACSPVAVRLANPGPHDPSTLADHIDRLDEVVDARQDHFATVVEPRLAPRWKFCEYLYGEERWTFPVLHACATLRDRIERARIKP
jgi:hypothetical protein